MITAAEIKSNNNVIATTTEPTKKCACCGRVLPMSSFHKNITSKDGKQSVCIQCRAEYDRQYRKRKREKKELAKLDEKPTDNRKIILTVAPSVNKKPVVSKTNVSLSSYSKSQIIEELKSRGCDVLVDPTPRDLMLSLKNKGYTGTLSYTEIRTVDLHTLV